MSEIIQDHMRLVLILRRAIGPASLDEPIIADAREMILAARRLASGGNSDAIIRRMRTIMQPYGLKPYDMRGAIVLPLDSHGFHFQVPL